ncbi:MAG: DUF58 domain-containing protein [Planctomycetes bacterium]|nr:DUF58 domain-containing protein [Planctomycetota bacterium]
MPGLLFDDAFHRLLERLQFVIRRARASVSEGTIATPQRGGAFEVVDRRDYAPGDDIRTIDWAASGRSDRLYVKEYAREAEARVVIALDASASMGAGPSLRPPAPLRGFGGLLGASGADPQPRAGGEAAVTSGAGAGSSPAWDHARRLAAALAYVALASEAPLRIGACSGGDWRQAPALRGVEAIHGVLKFLGDLQSAGPTALRGAFSRALSADPARALWLVISDLHDSADPRGAFAALAQHGHDPVCLHYGPADPGDVPEGPLRCTDSETGETLEMAVDPRVRDSLRAEASSRRAEWQTFATAHAIPYVPVNPSQPLESLVIEVLRRARVVA